VSIVKMHDQRYNLREMSRSELVTLKAEIVFNVSNMKQQIAEAKTKAYLSGKYADEEWWKAINTAMRISVRDIDLVNAALTAIKEAPKPPPLTKKVITDRPFSWYFIQAAKKHMEKDDFEYIEKLAELYRDDDERNAPNSPAADVTDQIL
jgi:nicotinamide riboside kinase